MLSRVFIEVEVIGSNLTRACFLKFDKPRARERELPKFDSNRRAEKLKSGNVPSDAR